MRQLTLALATAVALALGSDTAAAESRCVRWRATGRCDPHGQREPHNDASCEQLIAPGLSGYCECEGRRRVREVDCDHHTFTCAAACAEDSSADLSCA